MLSVSLAIATLSKCWYNVHNYKRQRNDCLKHFKGLDFCYNSVSTLSLSILSDLDELQQTEFARCLAPTLNNRNIVGIAKCLARFVAALVKMLFRDADFNHQRPRPALLYSIQMQSQMNYNQEQNNEALNNLCSCQLSFIVKLSNKQLSPASPSKAPLLLVASVRVR